MDTDLSRRGFLMASALATVAPSLALAAGPYDASPWRNLTDAEWKKRLAPASYAVLRHEDTERPGTSALLGEHRKGTFVCAGCALPLFKSDWKFESGTGWPSFYTAIQGAVAKKTDFKIGLPRTEYHCARCLGHQGHIFNDGPRPTGLRYCNNGVALKFAPTSSLFGSGGIN
jgi:peptide-methionine (R)-S-oxide reductase